jgi:uncharacterized Fe-S cluster-containing MiaB family protein
VSATAAYPTGRARRDRFVLAQRGERRVVDPWATPRVAIDPEPDGHGAVVDVATLFLTGRECPWRCVMCDLWRDTIEGDTPLGAIPHQIALGLAQPALQAGVEHLKLYNAGSFFDARAVPPADDPAIARAVSRFDRVIVESHPRLVGDRTWRFRDRLARSRRVGDADRDFPGGDGASRVGDAGPLLEVAIGLETAHPEALERVNKGCTVDDVVLAARALATHGVGLRVFLLVHPPFVPPGERDAWLARSIDVAIDAGASVISLIPTRAGNGAMERLAAEGAFAPPSLADVEDAARLARRRAAGRARVLVDLWDLAALASCAACLDARRARLLRLNLDQRGPDTGAGPAACAACGAAIGACR